MAAEFDKDQIWIGNYAHYNAGRLVGDWLELPADPADLNGWLKEHAGVDMFHEEVGIFDTDLGGNLGLLGVKIGEYDDIENINLLAQVVKESGLEKDQLERVGAWLKESVEVREDPMKVANAVLQADEVPCYFYSNEPYYLNWDSKEKCYGYHLVDDLGGLQNIDIEDKQACFDYEAFGRDCRLDGSLVFDENGVLSSTEDVDLDAQTLDEIAADLGLSDQKSTEGVEPLSMSAADRDKAVKELNEALGLSPAVLEQASNRDLAVMRELVEKTDPELLHGVELYLNETSGWGLAGAANALVQAKDIQYTPWDRELVHYYPNLDERAAHMIVDECGWDGMEENLDTYFNYEEFGKENSYDLTLLDELYIDNTQDGPDLERFSREDLLDEAGWGFQEIESVEGAQYRYDLTAEERMVRTDGAGNEVKMRQIMKVVADDEGGTFAWYTGEDDAMAMVYTDAQGNHELASDREEFAGNAYTEAIEGVAAGEVEPVWLSYEAESLMWETKREMEEDKSEVENPPLAEQARSNEVATKQQQQDKRHVSRDSDLDI